MTPENEVLIQVLATVFSVLGSLWWLDRKISNTRQELERKITTGDTNLRNDLKALDTKLSGEIKSLDTKLSGEIKELRQENDTAHKEILATLGGEIKEVRLASEEAHRDIRSDLSDIKIEQTGQSERLRCIETRLGDNRQDD